MTTPKCEWASCTAPAAAFAGEWWHCADHHLEHLVLTDVDGAHECVDCGDSFRPSRSGVLRCRPCWRARRAPKKAAA